MKIKSLIQRAIVCSMSIVFVLAITGSVRSQTSAPKPTPSSIAELELQQKQLANRFGKLEELFIRMSELEAASNPTRAGLLMQAAQMSKQLATLQRLSVAGDLLSQGQFTRAIQEQEAGRENLKKLLELLQSENRSTRLRDERARLQEIQQEIRRLEQIQRGQTARTESGQDFKQAATDQKDIKEQLDKVAGDLNKDKDEANKDEDGKSSDQGKESEPKSSDASPKDGSKEGDQDSKEPNAPKQDQNSSPDGNQSQKDKPTSDDPSKANSKSEASKDKDSSSEEDSDSSKQSSDSQPKDSKDDKSKDSDSNSKDKSDKDKNSERGKPKESSQENSKPQDSQSKDGQSKDKQSKDSQDSEQADGQQGGSSNDPKKPESREEKARKRVENSRKRMQKAQENLEKENREEAVEEQRQAEQELREAIEELERILRQLREEEIDRSLVDLETRLRKMLDLQKTVRTETEKLANLTGDTRDRTLEIQANKLSIEQTKVVMEGQRALLLLQDEGTSTAFPEALEQVNSDAQTVGKRLAEANVSASTQMIEDEIVGALEEMLESLKQVQKKREDKKQQRNQQQQQQQSGGEQDEPLVDSIAELKLLKTLQLRVNRRTHSLAKQVDNQEDIVGQIADPNLRGELEDLADRQQKIHEVTRDILLKNAKD